MTLIQCLVFIEIERGSTVAAENLTPETGSLVKESATKKYVLFPSGLKNHSVCKLLQEVGFQVLVNPPANLRFVFIEMLVDEKPVSNKTSLYISDIFCHLFERLLDKRCCIKSLSSCNASESILSAVDNENLILIGKFLVTETDIWWYSHPGQGGNILHFAAKTGQMALINLLLERGANPNAQMDDCSTVLHIAVQENKFQIASLVLKNNADVSAVKEGGITPMHIAAEKGFLEMVNLLVEYGADLRLKNAGGATPLHLAVKKGHVEIVEQLLLGAEIDLKCRAIINAKTNDCSTALYNAVSDNKLEIVRLLLKHNADATAISQGMTPLHTAVKKGFLEIVKLLVKNGAGLSVQNANTSTPLHLAVRIGNVEIVEQLLLGAEMDPERRAVINAKTNDRATALYHAVAYNKLEIVRLLLKHNADANTAISPGITPLHAAVENGFLVVVKLLVEYGADICVRRADGSTPLHLAVTKGHVEIVEQLLLGAETDVESGAAINAKMNNSSTPLFIAVSNNQLQIASLLLKYNADANALMCKHVSPLYIAAEKGFFEMVKLLVENGADLRFGNRVLTSLHIAVRERHMDIVKYLLLHGSNPNVRSFGYPAFMGETPLHISIVQGCVEIVSLLLQEGADVNAELYDGRTALNLALTTERLGESKQLEICQILAGHSLDVNNTSNRKAFYHVLTHLGAEYRQMAECLLRCGFDVSVDNAIDSRLLFGTVRHNLHQTVEKLLSFGASAQVFESEGEKLSLLHSAARYADGDMIQLLLSHGAEVNAVTDDSSKRTPLAVAIEFSNVSTVKALLANSARVKDSPALLHSAVRKCPEVVQLLLEYGADMYSYNSEGQTVLSVAAFAGNREVVDVLMKFGARCCFRDTTPANMSSSANCQAFLDYGFTDFDSESKIHFQKFLNRCRNYCNCTKYRDCAEKRATLAYQIIRMQVAFEFDGTPIPAELGQNLKLSDFKNSCEKEIANLKLAILPGADVSLYSILTKKTEQISYYARNERILQSLEALDVKGSYPVFASVLECQIRKGSLRRRIVKVGIKLMGALFRRFSDLPLELKEKTVNYLNNQDILVLKKCLNYKTDL